MVRIKFVATSNTWVLFQRKASVEGIGATSLFPSLPDLFSAREESASEKDERLAWCHRDEARRATLLGRTLHDKKAYLKRWEYEWLTAVSCELPQTLSLFQVHKTRDDLQFKLTSWNTYSRNMMQHWLHRTLLCMHKRKVLDHYPEAAAHTFTHHILAREWGNHWT